MHNENLHYDLSKDNIMLHFPPKKLDVVYIGVCIWGEIRYLQQVTPFFNGFAKEQDVIKAKKQIGGCLRTFFVHGKLKTTNSPWCMAK
jgi:hypothetical protein